MTSHPDASTDSPRHPVRAVVKRTGLSAHVLRAWERRYGVVAPTRSQAEQRLYSEADIARLSLLKALVESGAQISQLARLPDADLTRLLKEARSHTAPAPGEDHRPQECRRDALQAVESMDPAGLRRGLERGALSLGVSRLVEEVVAPILAEIGDRWHAGRLSIAQEHLGSGVVRQVLHWARDLVETGIGAPCIVVGTPPGQFHEGGALLAAALAAGEGWRVSYLGSNLPVSEIAATARRVGARAVALSLVYPGDDPAVHRELRTLAGSLPEGVAFLAGGASASAYAKTLAEAGGLLLTDLAELRNTLRTLSPPRAQ